MYVGGEKQVDGMLMGWKVLLFDEWVSCLVFFVKQDVCLFNESVVYQMIGKLFEKVMVMCGLMLVDVDWFLLYMFFEYFCQLIVDCMVVVGFLVVQERWFINLYIKGNIGLVLIYIMVDELLKSG